MDTRSDACDPGDPCLDLSLRRRRLDFVTGSRARTFGLRERLQRLTAFAACAAWLLAALTCPGFGLTIGPDEPVVAHEQITHDAPGQADADFCCKAMGDSAAVFQPLSYVRHDIAVTPAPAIAITAILPTGLFLAPVLDRPPLYETARSRAKRFLAFSSHAPPTTIV